RARRAISRGCSTTCWCCARWTGSCEKPWARPGTTATNAGPWSERTEDWGRLRRLRRRAAGSAYFRGYKVLALLIQPQRCKFHAGSGAVESAGLAIDRLARRQLGPQVREVGNHGFDTLDDFGCLAAQIVRQLFQTLFRDLSESPGVLVFVNVDHAAVLHAHGVFLAGGAQQAHDAVERLGQRRVGCVFGLTDGLDQGLVGGFHFGLVGVVLYRGGQSRQRLVEGLTAARLDGRHQASVKLVARM